MKTVSVSVEGVSAISFGRNYVNEVPKLPKESEGAYELRTWRNKMHTDAEGTVIIPANMPKNMLRDIGAFLNEKIPGKGAATYKKHFLSGVMVFEPASLGVKASAVASLPLHVPSNGISGSGKRVWKTFPIIPRWATTFEVTIVDDTITTEVFERHFEEAGRYIGLGFWRPARGGLNGRFAVKAFDWK